MPVSKMLGPPISGPRLRVHPALNAYQETPARCNTRFPKFLHHLPWPVASRTMYLNRIHIQNLRAIRDLSLDFGQGVDTRRWTVLLGENGCGKSTVLKAIALVLAGSEALAELIDDADAWIHNDASFARVHAEISTAKGEKRELLLELRRGEGRSSIIRKNYKSLAPLDFAVAKADRNYFIAGYGAFRRPPDPKRAFHARALSSINRAANVGTLFSPANELVSLEQWAAELDYAQGEEGRNVIKSALGALLPGMAFENIDKESLSIMMRTRDGLVSLRNLSEGYQAMAAWAGDILYRMTRIFGGQKNPLRARGVLLIDEMDLHLHPVWKRNFVDFLNNVFPNMQIIATTHSPLSIQQCGEGELFVIKREGDQPPSLIAFNGDPSKLRLSELFLSPLIGLDTLDSPRVAALREEARRIELAPGKKSAVNQKRLRLIAHELEGTNPLPVAEAPSLAPVMAQQAALEALLPAWLRNAPTAVDKLRSGAFDTKPSRATAPSPIGPGVRISGRAVSLVAATAAAKPAKKMGSAAAKLAGAGKTDAVSARKNSAKTSSETAAKSTSASTPKAGTRSRTQTAANTSTKRTPGGKQG